MKLASIIVLLIVSIVPMFIRALSIFYLFFTKGIEGVEATSNRITDPKTLKSRPRLVYTLLVLYGLLFLASLFWVIIEFTSGLGQIGRVIITLSVEMLILISVILGWSILRVQRLRERFPPPPAGASEQAFQDYQNDFQNRNFEENVQFTPHRIKVFLIMLGVSIFVMVGTIVIAALLFR